MHDGTNITCRQSVCGQVNRQCYTIEFFNHVVKG
jgi:hypothetical protein